MEDLLNHRYEFADQDLKVQDMLMDLLPRINWLMQQPGNPVSNWTVTSGLRTIDDHLRIYKDKATKHQKPFENGVFDQSKVPMKSRHLYGRAADISDPGLKITAWLKVNESLLEQAGLWCEEGNTNWVHFQNEPPASGKRWFLP
jgi:uncharacterized protein YcbK (DUF882 family)